MERSMEGSMEYSMGCSMERSMERDELDAKDLPNRLVKVHVDHCLLFEVGR